MSPYAEALHEYVQASNEYRALVTGAHVPSLREEERAEQRLASAGDRLESALREMIREEAEKLLAERFH